ncbi:MAG: hypothetical protein ACRD09_07140, partial [Vicinamibacterales bacterium]
MKKLMWAAAAIALTIATNLSAQQPTKMGGSAGPAPDVPGGDLALGSVRITRAVTADGKPLKPGTY